MFIDHWLLPLASRLSHSATRCSARRHASRPLIGAIGRTPEPLESRCLLSQQGLASTVVELNQYGYIEVRDESSDGEDNRLTISVDAVVFFRICAAIDSVPNIENVRHSTQLLAQTTLRNILGTKTLAEVSADREQIKSYMQV